MESKPGSSTNGFTRRRDTAHQAATDVLLNIGNRGSYMEKLRLGIELINERINRYVNSFVNKQPKEGELDRIAIASDFIRFLTVTIEDEQKFSLYNRRCA